MTQVSAIGPAFNFLLANLPAAMTAADPKVSVSDNWPDNPEAQRQLVIGRSGPSNGETQVVGVTSLMTLGAGRVNEQFTIPCFIQVISGGQTDQSVSRDAALVVWNAFMAWLMSNLTLGGCLNAGNVSVSQLQIEGTPDGFVGAGRSTLITFDLLCKNQYLPLGS